MRKFAGLVASVVTSVVLACSVIPATVFADPAVELSEAAQEEAIAEANAESEEALIATDFDDEVDVSDFQKLEEVELDDDEAVALSADAQTAASIDEDLDFEAYVIPKTTYNGCFIPIYIKTKFADKFYLNFYDSDGNAVKMTTTSLSADDVVGEWNGYDYKLQNADGRIIVYAFDEVGTYTMAVVAADGYYDGPTLAKFKITVDMDYEQAENEYIDWLIANVTDSSMDSFEKMSAIESYLRPKMKYLRGYKGEDGDYAGQCRLLEDYCTPWWIGFTGSSYTTPAILCKIANRVGGFTDVHNCYGDYPRGTDGWISTHYLCKCTGVDKNGVEKERYYYICPFSDTNLVDAKDASEIPKLDFSDLSGYQKLQQTVSYCRITFNVNGGTISGNDFRTVEKGGKLSYFPRCSKDGYVLEGWYTDKGLTSKFDKNTAVNSNIQLYAKWAVDASGATVEIADQVWTGKALMPAPTVTLNGKTLKQGTDYTVAYSDNTNVGMATVTVTFKGNYAGTAKRTFSIKTVDASKARVSVPNQTYTGSSLTPAPTVTLNGKTLKQGTDYDVSYSGVVDAGTATVRVTFKGNYSGDVWAHFKIAAMDASKADVVAANQKWTGKELTPAVTVTINGKALEEWKDYTLSYSNNIKVGTATVKATFKGNYTGVATGSFSITERSAPSVMYQAHVQNIGWQGSVKDGATAGTSGQSLRVEALSLWLSSSYEDSRVQIRAHVQDIGWQGWSSMGGTTGQSKRVEAMQIRLTGEMANHYDVYYRVHAQNIGWMGWAKNGESAGTEGMSLRLEAIQVKLVPKGGAAPGSTANAFRKPAATVEYQAHVQNIGWQSVVSDGAVAGTSGQSLRVEALRVSLKNADYAGGVQIRAHVQDIGWQGWSTMGGTYGQSKRVEAMQIRLTGEMAKHYDVYYRVHAQNIGWMGWAKNGEQAGTAGYSYRLEAIQIKLVPKGSAAPGSTANRFRSR